MLERAYFFGLMYQRVYNLLQFLQIVYVFRKEKSYKDFNSRSYKKEKKG